MKTMLTNHESEATLIVDSFIPSKLLLDIKGIYWFREQILSKCYLSKSDLVEKLESGVPVYKIREFLMKTLTKEAMQNLVRRYQIEYQRDNRIAKKAC